VQRRGLKEEQLEEDLEKLKQDQKIELRLLDLMQNSYVHLILIGHFEKSRYLRFCSVARKELTINLSVKKKPAEIIKEINSFLDF